MSLKIRCGKNLRTDFAIYGRVGDFANFYDFLMERCNLRDVKMEQIFFSNEEKSLKEF